mgnify:FL=1
MKKVTVALSLLFVLCLGLAASAATPIKIGYLAALTGDYAA